MLKYLYTKEIFKEVPGEITLGIAITGCTIKCKGCHSKELWKDQGKDLNTNSLKNLIKKYKGITCLCLLGGEHDINSIIKLLTFAKSQGLKTAWYCGLDEIPINEKIGLLKVLDYYKLGHYDEKLGGLDSPTTNQKLYKCTHKKENFGDVYYVKDITYKLQKNETENKN